MLNIHSFVPSYHMYVHLHPFVHIINSKDPNYGDQNTQQ